MPWLPYFVPNTVKEHLAVAPSEDEETEDELERQTPDHMSPHNVGPAGGEDVAQEDDGEDSTGGDQSLSVIDSVDDEEDGDANQDEDTQEPFARSRADKPNQSFGNERSNFPPWNNLLDDVEVEEKDVDNGCDDDKEAQSSTPIQVPVSCDVIMQSVSQKGIVYSHHQYNQQ